MSYIPPHRRRRKRREAFLSGLVESSVIVPPTCKQDPVPLWTSLIKTSLTESKAKQPWYHGLDGYVLLKRDAGQISTTVIGQPRDETKTHVVDKTGSLIALLDSHTEDYYEKFPHETIYDPPLDYESSSDEEAEENDEDEYLSDED